MRIVMDFTDILREIRSYETLYCYDIPTASWLAMHFHLVQIHKTLPNRRSNLITTHETTHESYAQQHHKKGEQEQRDNDEKISRGLRAHKTI